MQYRPVSDKKWPDSQQRLLLRAALTPGTEGLEAWRQWSDDNDIESIDSASFFILPQVYANLKAFGRDVTEYDLIKGVYRWTWSQNQLTIAGLADILRLLNNAHIPTVVLKGIPLARHYYKDLAVRMMKDVDLLVQVADVPRVISALQDSGWRQKHRQPSKYLMSFLEAIHFVHPQWPKADIHWRPFRLDTPASAEVGLWDNAVEDSISGVSTRVPSATDLLLSTCFHARKADLHATCRWVVDSMVLITQARERLDWGRLFDSSQELGLLLPVRDAISYLYTEFDAPVPESALQDAWSSSATAVEQDRYRHMIQHGVNPSIRDVMGEHWTRYSDVRPGQGQLFSIAGFARYFLAHCSREITLDSVPGLAKRFFWDRLSRSSGSS